MPEVTEDMERESEFIVQFFDREEPSDDPELEELERLSNIFSVLDKPAKLKVLTGIRRGKSLTEIKEEVDVSGTSVHNYVNEMIEADLVVKDNREYHLSSLGEWVLMAVEGVDQVVKYYAIKTTLMEMPGELGEEIVDQALKDENIGSSELSIGDLKKWGEF
ncbi:Winged helix DNA-binding domain-containing protein [Haloarcula vallismortis]|uniref:HTH arsR-type domain-containing protein n=2 Tax=Haloarcula vallismortis TaxID=28442 RepID=M0JVB4_HALVA|nr:winged helix DNA-binding protein [Haloarcula vallismortis]EMA11580.1 hypothetical protein C437_01670 [Haloarcula vallismortis ATCC 29715]SDW45410.1 Winged helix DNA-binding domain-containing protein [Haloarcula vallismortis]